MADPATQPNANPYVGRPAYFPPSKNTAMGAAFKLDEGYSEETRSQSDGDTAIRQEPRGGDLMEQDMAPLSLPDWVLALGEDQRAEFALEILKSLRTSSIASIVEKLKSRLHLDPVLYLPPEITFQIFSYLEPETLLKTTVLSKPWRSRALDSQLWRVMYGNEGWTASISQIRQFEAAEKANRLAMRERKTRVRGGDNELERKPTKRRIREQTLFGEPPQHRPFPSVPGESSGGPDGWAEQHGPIEADEALTRGSDDAMQEVVFTNPAPPSPEANSVISPPPQDMMTPPVRPSLVLSSQSDPTVNWHYLYKQKRRLEDNWTNGRWTNFQLPHPAHPYEAHSECVYTIQHTAKHVVSGSRDKTIRIWDLESQRLVIAPLTGHSASVLCLQFDESPEEDIVASGGSDCHVIIWRFSTGQMLRKLERAHSESVLNLIFDRRYLITSSKDKSIKIWNRRQLLPTDEDYPKMGGTTAKFPSYIIDIQRELESQSLNTSNLKPLKEFSVLMTLEGHSAAVNAIQLYDDQIVSASGDRSVKVWDIHTGQCLKTFTGHTKGIATVQFDGRRIVTGSSDETVRIFDHATGAEVACLRGHANLVRTVQAQFGDLPGADEELEAEARAVDKQYFEARATGVINDLSREERRARNAGSRNPQHIFAYGAKLPPGGGGSRWGRIVSGSYDETIIVWKKSPVDGKWVAAKRLLQSEAATNAGGRRRTTAGRAAQQQAQAIAAATPPNRDQQAREQQMHDLQQQAIQQMQDAQSLANYAQTLQAGQAQQQAAAQATAGQFVMANPLPGIPTGPVNFPVNPPPAANMNNNGHHGHHHHHHHHNPSVTVAAGTANPPASNSRVFKLQFDARRIICCSQDPTIVGWDFANGDPEIMAASRFFAEAS
ncbi:WD40 repeat-like protein [Saccharata proteae CBS 121410]|uniref:Mitochondrial division protein 1 n=1 Tax=Saccharata proteae CBS 121410 TaxID=1314787 RepID=A0A6A5YCT0_9PEZI|nr:WD40 repeat-like protein [Saccharata proteae CBS 121410]